MSDTFSDEERADLAAELALGLLSGRELADALRMQLSDPAFAADVEAWKIQLAPMLRHVPSVQAPHTAWPGIVARINGSSIARDSANLPLISKLKIWRAFGVAASLVAASLLLILIATDREKPRPVAVSVALLLGTNAGQRVTAAYRQGAGTLQIETTVDRTADHAPELWIIPADGVPRSLGLIPKNGMSGINVPEIDQPLLTSGAILAVTLERPETAPHAAPSGAPILTGKIMHL